MFCHLCYMRWLGLLPEHQLWGGAERRVTLIRTVIFRLIFTPVLLNP